MFSSKLSVVPGASPFAATVLIVSLALVGCSSKPLDATAGWSPNKIYAEAKDEARSGSYDKAIPLFEKLEGRAAGTPLAQQAHFFVLHGAVAERELARPPDLNGVVLTGAVAPRFSICVNNVGRVILALPLESPADGKQMRALHKGVSSLRFKPVKGPEAQWGEASFVWENPQP